MEESLLNLLPPSDSVVASLASGIRLKNERAVEEFYTLFRKRFLRRVGQQLGFDAAEDILQTAFTSVLEAVQHGKLDDPCLLFAYAATVVRRQIVRGIRELSIARTRYVDFNEVEFGAATPQSDPEHLALRGEALRIAAEILRRMPGRDREILRRFYVLGQSKEEIGVAMGLDYNEFRNAKHRAKKRLTPEPAPSVKLPARRPVASAGAFLTRLNKVANS